MTCFGSLLALLSLSPASPLLFGQSPAAAPSTIIQLLQEEKGASVQTALSKKAPEQTRVSEAAKSEVAAPEELPPWEKILSFWFGSLSSASLFPEGKEPVWQGSSQEVRRQVIDQFKEDAIKAYGGAFNSWRAQPRGRLALIILLDDIPRIIYQGQPQQYVADRMALTLALEGMQMGEDKRLYPIERAFFYFPLAHAEDIDLQNLSVSSYEQLLSESPKEIRPHLLDFLSYAFSQRQLIARFGRFPYRNGILGRESTPEETAFLMQKNN